MFRPSAEIAAGMHQRTLKRGWVPVEMMFQNSVFTDERAMNKNENKKKYFSGLSSLATPNGFGVCDWYQFLITKHLLPTIAQPKNYLLSSAFTVFSRVTYETSKNYNDI